MLHDTLRPPSEPRSGILPVDPRTVVDIAMSMVNSCFTEIESGLLQLTHEVSSPPLRSIRVDGSSVWVIFTGISAANLPEGMEGVTITLKNGTQQIAVGFQPNQHTTLVEALSHAVKVISHEMAHAIDPEPVHRGSADSLALSLSDLIHDHAIAMLGHDIYFTVTVERYEKPSGVQAPKHFRRTPAPTRTPAVVIDALIHVKTDRQVQEVLGHRGQILKEIMLRTRAELEREIKETVKLNLDVTTEPNKTAEEYYNHPSEVNAYLTQEIVKLYLMPEGYIVPLVAVPFNVNEVYRHTNYPEYERYLTPRNRRRFKMAAFWWYETTRENVANSLETLKTKGEFPPWFTLQDFANYLEEQMRKDRRTYRKAVTLETLRLRREMYAR